MQQGPSLLGPLCGHQHLPACAWCEDRGNLKTEMSLFFAWGPQMSSNGPAYSISHFYIYNTQEHQLRRVSVHRTVLENTPLTCNPMVTPVFLIAGAGTDFPFTITGTLHGKKPTTAGAHRRCK